MAVSLRLVGLVAGFLGLIQGFVWTCLSVAALLIRFDVWKIKYDEKSHNGNIYRALVALFKEGNDITTDELLVQPTTLTIWIFAYLVASIIWILISIWVLTVRFKTRASPQRTSFILWSIWTGVISTSDLLLGILLMVDYSYCLEQLHKNWDAPGALLYIYKLLAIGTVLVIAHRGFVLWIINVAVLVILTKKLWSNRKKDDMQNTPPSSNNSLSISHGSMDRPNSIYTRSNSFNATSPYKINLPRLAPVPAVPAPAQRFGQLSREESRNPPAQSYIYPQMGKQTMPSYLQPNIKDGYSETNAPRNPRPHYIYGEKY